jgi:hypothetical protein
LSIGSNPDGECAAAGSTAFLPDLLQPLANLTAAAERAECFSYQACHDPSFDFGGNLAAALAAAICRSACEMSERQHPPKDGFAPAK